MDLRMPNITGTTDREMLQQIRSYLYQLVPQLQFAVGNIEASVQASNVAPQVITGKATSSTPVTAEDTFNNIKALIIKSADIVEAYYEQINARLEGLYVAESDFGTFVEETEMRIEANSTGVTQYYEDKQKIDSIDDLNEYRRNTEGYIKTGIVDYDDNGFAIIGVEIRQGNTADGEEKKRLARFTADRLTFFDSNGIDVAYISNEQLVIKKAEVLTKFTLGGYVDEVVGGGIVTKWVGGN